jgi:hypothetical protein
MMAATKGRNEGKTTFLKEYLQDNPESKVGGVLEAWKSAGMSGTISTSLIAKVRSDLGLTGKRGRKKMKAAVAARGRKVSSASIVKVEVPMNLAPRRGRVPSRNTLLMELEAEIDRLIFKVMSVRDLPDVENSLRVIRRSLYRKYSG